MKILTISFVLLALSCQPQTRDDTIPSVPVTANTVEGASQDSPPGTMPSSAPESAPLSGPSAEAIDARVANAKQRLSSSDGGKKVWASIEAAGGLTPWFASGDIKFRFSYRPTSRPATDTIQTVDTWGSRARHQLVSDPEIEFGWDGRVAWVSPADADVTTNVRFWSLTPYYFVGIPFVLADPGVNLEVLPDAEFEGAAYDIVKATFAAGTGDASDDYYVLYLDKKTHRVRALRYVVSYKGFRPDGGHGPEKLMAYDGDIAANGLTFAATHRTFKFDEESGEVGEKVTDVTVSDLSFRSDTPESYFDPPEGAKIIEGWK